MRSHRFFADISLNLGSTQELPSDAAHHCSQVLRHKVSDQLTVFNGDGFDYDAVIKNISKKSCQIEILNKHPKNNESPTSIHLIQGVARGDKMDFIIQKAVELGVNEITPLFTERCNVKLDAKRLAKKMQHWLKVIISACEQSGRAKLPTLHQPVSIENLELADTSTNILLEPTATESISCLPVELSGNRSNKPSINLLIGPEGGFSERDLSSATRLNIMGIRMGPRILRTETAGLSAIAILQSRLGDLS